MYFPCALSHLCKAKFCINSYYNVSLRKWWQEKTSEHACDSWKPHKLNCIHSWLSHKCRAYRFRPSYSFTVVVHAVTASRWHGGMGSDNQKRTWNEAMHCCSLWEHLSQGWLFRLAHPSLGEIWILTPGHDSVCYKEPLEFSSSLLPGHTCQPLTTLNFFSFVLRAIDGHCWKYRKEKGDDLSCP